MWISNEAVQIAHADNDKKQPDVVAGSSRGGAVATNIDSVQKFSQRIKNQVEIVWPLETGEDDRVEDHLDQADGRRDGHPRRFLLYHFIQVILGQPPVPAPQ